MIHAREMMFGWKKPFDYGECPNCRSLQICRVPENLAEFYPSDYYSFSAPAKKGGPGPLRRLACRAVLGSRSGWAGAITRLISRKYPFIRWAWLARIDLDAEVLDVGCGSGGWLRRMQRWGFRRLSGVDPYLEKDISESELHIAKAELAEVKGKFSLIMFHHVIEHVVDPVETLRLARERLLPGGHILVRCPVAGSFVAREYGADWFNLDAPRHLVIPSVAGMGHAAREAGLKIAVTEFDSDEKSVIMSERYRRGIPMKDTSDMPGKAVRKQQRRMADKLNRSGDADLGVFVLTAE